MWVRAVHKNPKERQLVLIVSGLSKSDNSQMLISKSKAETINLEEFDPGKESKLPKEDQQWTLRIIPEEDFLMSLGIPCMQAQESTNQTRINSSIMELITINSIKTPLSTFEDFTSISGKKLDSISSEDVIEVFI